MPRQLFERTERYGRATQWGRSRLTVKALNIFTELPVRAAQRIGVLESTVDPHMLHTRLAKAIETEVDRIEAEVRQGDLDEFDAALLDAAESVRPTLPEGVTDEQLLEIADREVKEVRAARRARPVRRY